MLRTATRCLLVLPLLALLVATSDGQNKISPEVVTKFKGHTDSVHSVAYSPDGKLLVTGSFDHSIKLWDIASGKEIKSYAGTTGHTKQVLSVAVSQDGQMIASGSVDNTLKVWDLPTSTPIRSFKTNDVSQAVSLSADGTKLAVGGKDGSVRILNAADFKELAKMDSSHQGAVNSVAFSANGLFVASAGADRTLRFWNAVNGQSLGVVGAHAAPVNAVALHPNATTAYTVGDDGTLKFWNVAQIAPKLLTGHTANLRAAALSNDASQLVTGGDDKTVRQFATAGKEIRPLVGATANLASVAINPANALVAAGSLDNKVMLWNAADGKLLTQFLAHAGPVTSVQFHPAAPQMLTGGADGLVKTWALPPVAPKVLPHPDAVLATTTSADGKKVVTGSADKLVRVWEPTKPAIERQYAGHTGPVTAVALSPNLQILASGSSDATIRLWNQATGKETDILLGHTAPITSLQIHPNGTQMFSASEDGSLKLWQFPVVAPKAMVHPDQVAVMALTPDASKVLTGSNDKIVRLWNLASGAKERDFAGPTLPVTALAVAANNATLAAASADKTLHVWNLADAKVLQKLPLATPSSAIAYAADAQSIFVGLADGSIKWLKVADGKENKTLAGQKGAINSLLVAPKGDLLYSASADKTIQTFALPDGAPKAKFDHVAPVAAMALSKDGTKLAALADKSVKVWSLPDGKEIATFAVAPDTRSLGFSPDITKLALAGADKLVRIVNLQGSAQESFAHEGPVQAVAFVDAKRIVSAGADKTTRVWTTSLLWQGLHQGPIRQALFTPKGDQILSAGDDKVVKFWNAADGKEVRSLANPEAGITHLSLNADATKLALAAQDKAIKVWNLVAAKGTPDETKPQQVIPCSGPVQSLALAPNGLRVAYACTEPAGQPIHVHDLALGRDVQVIVDHVAPVKSLGFLGDNRTLVSASLDKSTRIQDVSVIGAFVAHPVGPVLAQYHNSGTQLLTAGADKTIKIWDLAKNAVTKTFGPVADPIKAITYSRDYTKVGVATGKIAKVWTIADGKETLSLTHPVDVLSLAFSADNTKIATGAADKLTRVWDVPTGKELQFFAQDDAVEAVFFTPANNVVVSAAGKTPRVETLSIQKAVTVDAGPASALTFAANNTHVLTGGADKIAKLVNIGNGAVERSFPGAAGPITAVAISKAVQLVAVAGADMTVRVYAFADGKELGVAKVGGPVKSLAFTPNNLALLVTAADKSMVALSVAFTPGQPNPPEFLTPVQTFAAPDVALDVAVAADNATVYSGGLDKAVHVWKLASPIPTRNFPHPNHVDAVAFQPGGNLVASGCHDGKVRWFDLVKNALVKEVNAHPGAMNQPPNPIYTVAFTPDGKQILSSSFDNSLKLWDVASGNLVREFKPHKVKDFEKGHLEPVYTAAFSPDGKFLASGSGGLERVVKIWNMADGSVVRDLANPDIKTPPMQPVSSHPGWIYALRFTKDGKHLISIGDAPKNGGFLAVWDWQAGKLLASESLTLGTLYSMALAPDEKSVAVGAGNRGRPNPEFNSAYLMKLPILGK